jgi:hypothetical protein
MKRAFKGIWIPREIWLSEELSLQEKVLLVEIESLTQNNKGYCYASNSYFSKFFHVSKSRISQVISSLSKRKIIEVWDIKKGKQFIERRIKINKDFSAVSGMNGGSKKTKQGYLENCAQSNTRRES